jgi:hypothetical protein
MPHGHGAAVNDPSRTMSLPPSPLPSPLPSSDDDDDDDDGVLWWYVSRTQSTTICPTSCE